VEWISCPRCDLARAARLAGAGSLRRSRGGLARGSTTARCLDADAAEPIGDFTHVGDRVVARLVWRGRGRGPESSMETTCVYTLRKRKITAFEFFWDHAEALEAAGLSE
jgi:ketosteroid isomerase-like protein